MRVVVVEKVTVRTPEGERVLVPGQTFNIAKDKAIELLTLGKVRPSECVVYKVWSELLQEHILVGETDKDKAIIPNPEKLVAYSPAEIRELGKLKGRCEDIKVWHEAKKLLEGDILEVERKDDKGGRG